MQIRTATEKDIEALAVLGARTFSLGFAHLYSDADLQSFVQSQHSPAYYQAALDDPDIGILVLEDGDGALRAYSTYGPNTLPCDPPRPQALELKRIYVDPAYQGQGWGLRLIETIIPKALAAGFTEIVLSVFSKNEAGIRFYNRLGFTQIGDAIFQVGAQSDHDYILSKPLIME